MHTGKTKKGSAADLDEATKDAMTDWIKKNPKLGGKLRKMGYTDWDIWRAFSSLNKDFLSVIIKAAA